ncbi:NUDIX hydrolase [Jatrophihabitans fulvus]
MGELDDFELLSSETVFSGKVLTVAVDEVRMPDGSSAHREVVRNPGAVAVVALDDEGRVVLVNQYRHPVGARLDELPAGLLDMPGESALEAAQREFVEEAGLQARRWHVLVDLFSSPGMSDEAVRVFLARDLSPVDRGDFALEHEEASMTVTREPLTEAVRRVMAGTITNAIAVSGILAAVHGRATDWRHLRPSDAPWPAKPEFGG